MQRLCDRRLGRRGGHCKPRKFGHEEGNGLCFKLWTLSPESHSRHWLPSIVTDERMYNSDVIIWREVIKNHTLVMLCKFTFSLTHFFTFYAFNVLGRSLYFSTEIRILLPRSREPAGQNLIENWLHVSEPVRWRHSFRVSFSQDLRICDADRRSNETSEIWAMVWVQIRKFHNCLEEEAKFRSDPEEAGYYLF
jgi:hypothetical protein